MKRITKIQQFRTGKESGKIGATYLDSGLLFNGTQEDILFLLDGMETYLGNSTKSTFDGNSFFRLGTEFLAAMCKLLQEIGEGGCDLPTDQVPTSINAVGSCHP